MISEVKDIESHVLWALWKIMNKKNLKFHIELNLNNFQERKYEKVFG